MLSTADAATGLAARARFGPPPRDLAAFIAWVETHFPLIVRWSDALPDGVDGSYRGVDDPAFPLHGMIFLRRGAEHARWVLAHELGHALTGCRVGYFLWSDGRYHANLAAERAANQCAAALLLDVYAIRDLLEADWRISDVARSEGATPDAIALRLQLGVLLGEYRETHIEATQTAMATGGA
jgi:hypothetical protein